MSTFFPPVEGTLAQYGTIWVTLLLASALLIGLWRWLQKSLIRKPLLSYLLVVVVLGWIFYWFRYENVLYFTADWIIYLWLAIVLIGLIWLVSIRLIKVPKIKKVKLEIDTKTKYLPKKKLNN